MTHDELLYGIKQIERLAEGMWGTKALRAVVELHKPITQADGSVICDSCSNSEFFPYKDCPTIKAIEKELHG